MPPKKIRVSVSIKPNKLKVSPIRVTIQPTGEEVVWKCSGGRLDILFNKVTSPFGSPQMQAAADVDLPSGEPITTTAGPYPYTLVITPDDGGFPITVDPQVDIDDPGPPRNAGSRSSGSSSNRAKGKHRKAAKKKAGHRKRATKPHGPKKKR